METKCCQNADDNKLWDKAGTQIVVSYNKELFAALKPPRCDMRALQYVNKNWWALIYAGRQQTSTYGSSVLCPICRFNVLCPTSLSHIKPQLLDRTDTADPLKPINTMRIILLTKQDVPETVSELHTNTRPPRSWLLLSNRAHADLIHIKM